MEEDPRCTTRAYRRIERNAPIAIFCPWPNVKMLPALEYRYFINTIV